MAAGFSEDYTPIKQEHLEAFVRPHMKIVKGIIPRPYAYGQYVWVDLNAGHGFDRHGNEGSAAIVQRLAIEEDVPLDMWLFERDRNALRDLRARFSANRAVHIVEGDHRETWPRVATAYHGRLTVFGGVYSDPNGGVLHVPTLTGLSSGTLSHMDLLMHINPVGGYKWNRHLHPDRLLADDLRQLGKTYQWVRQPLTPWQWILVAASNVNIMPISRSRGWVLAESEAGQSILRRTTYTKEQLRDALQSTFAVDGKER